MQPNAHRNRVQLLTSRLHTVDRYYKSYRGVLAHQADAVDRVALQALGLGLHRALYREREQLLDVPACAAGLPSMLV